MNTFEQDQEYNLILKKAEELYKRWSEESGYGESPACKSAFIAAFKEGIFR